MDEQVFCTKFVLLSTHIVMVVVLCEGVSRKIAQSTTLCKLINQSSTCKTEVKIECVLPWPAMCKRTGRVQLCLEKETDFWPLAEKAVLSTLTSLMCMIDYSRPSTAFLYCNQWKTGWGRGMRLRCSQVIPLQLFWGFSVYCGCKMNWAAAPWVALCN